MPAPGISAFGDGDHEEGETGLIIDGGGFGAFPGSAWMFENSDGSGAADQLTVGAWDDVQISGVEIPASPSNVPGTVYLMVQREDFAWSNPFTFTLSSGVLSVNLTGTLTMAGGLIRSTSKITAGVLTLAGALSAVKVAVVTLVGSLTMTGALNLSVGKVLAGSIAPSGSLIKMISRAVAGTLTSAGSLSSVKAALVSLSGVLSMSGQLTRAVGIASLSGQLTPTGALTRLTSVSLSGVLTFVGDVSSVIVGAVIYQVRVVIGHVKDFIVIGHVKDFIKTGRGNQEN